MKPLTVVTGIVLGTCLSIAVSLAAVLLMFVVLSDEYPRLEHEFRALIESLAIFTAMTAISAVSFYWMLINHPKRLLAQAVMWLGLVAAGFALWP